MKVKPKGYRATVEHGGSDDPDFNELLDSLLPFVPIACIQAARELASGALKNERIFDWHKFNAPGKSEVLSGPAYSAIAIMRYAEAMEKAMSASESENPESALVYAFFLGVHFEAVQAQRRWDDRNPPPTALEVRKAKVESRRNALAEYILGPKPKGGERPENRPGNWYEGFRELYRDHAACDKTLKADYLHALAIVRKKMKKGSTKLS